MIWTRQLPDATGNRPIVSAADIHRAECPVAGKEIIMKPLRRTLYMVLLACIPTISLARTPDPSMHAEKLAGICGDIFARTLDDTNPEEYSYAYERKIYDAAGVDFKADTAAIARDKIQFLWTHHQDRLQCSSVNFAQTRGGILKYAVEMKVYGMIDNAVKTWRLDLNMIDGSGDTLLDFIKYKIDQNHGNANGPVLVQYYDRLRRYGAKHCTELADTSRCGR